MNPNLTTVAAWSYGLAGFAYTAFAVYLGLGWRGGQRSRTLAVAVGLTAAWALVNVLLSVTQAPWLFVFGSVVDVLRIGAWYAFLLLLNEGPRDRAATAPRPRTTWLVPVAAALVVLGLFAQVAFARRFLGLGDVRSTHARIRIESGGAIALHGQLGAVTACGGVLNAQWRTLERYAGIASIDPLHASVTTIVVHDLRRTAPVGGLRRFAV